MKEFLWILFGALIAAAVGTAVAQRGPSELTGCIVNTGTPAYTNGMVVPLICDATGKLRMTTS